MIRKFIMYLLCILGGSNLILAQCMQSDKEIFKSYLNAMHKVNPLSEEDLIDETGKYFLGVPYVGKTLEREPEELVVNLRKFDCMTFVENVLALAKTYAAGTFSWSAFLDNLKFIRYRNGLIENFTSRLHYTSDWIYENERNGLIIDMTKAIGGVLLDMNVSFMSTYPENYVQLQTHPEYISVMAEKEKEINSRVYYYIPKEMIDKYTEQIHTGDIVCFVTSINGLDISHVGIIHKEGTKVTFIHASSTKKKVIINEESIQDYVLSIKKNRGIIVLRPQIVFTPS